MGLNAHWQNVLSFLPSGLITAAGAIGIIIIVAFVVVWLWRSKSGANPNAKSFPLMPVIIGGILAAPRIIIPAVLLVIDVLLRVVVIIFEAINSWF